MSFHVPNKHRVRTGRPACLGFLARPWRENRSARARTRVLRLTPNAALRGAEPALSAERPLEGTVMRKE